MLQNNSGNSLAVSASGAFTFTTAIADGAAYSVTVLTQPSSPAQTCAVSSGSGTVASANVSGVTVSCTTNTYTVGGTVSGLTGSGLVLQNSSGNNLAVSVNGAFTFTTAIADGAAYNVTVLTQPTTPAQTCTVSSGAGTVASANVSGVAVSCSTNSYTVGGTVSGLTGSGLVLQNNSGNNLSISADGAFTFSTSVASGAVYSVTVLTQPNSPNQICSVSNGNGTVVAANVAGVSVSCAVSTTQMGGARQGVELNLTSAVTTLAGTPFSQDGTGADANFKYPAHIVRVGGDLFVADSNNHTIRQIVITTGGVTTLAGTAGEFGSADGAGVVARFSSPSGITSDGTNLYVADYGNSTIRQIVIATGVVTTLAGSAGVSGSADGTGTAAEFNFPRGITSDGINLYVADTSNQTIRQIVIATGVVTTLAGTAGGFGSFSDGTGAAAGFSYPRGITTDNTNLYVTDNGNHAIRQIVIATGVVTTLAGNAGSFGSIDGTGAAAEFNYPDGIITDNTNLYVADTYNHTIRQIVIATGVVTTLAGTAGVSPASGRRWHGRRFAYVAL